MPLYSIIISCTQQHVLLTSPITLLALLKAMAYGWQQENRAQNVQQIIDHSHKLQQELQTFSAQGKKFHKKLSDTSIAFDKLTTTYNNKVLPVVQQICDLDGTMRVEEYALPSKKIQAPKDFDDVLSATNDGDVLNLFTVSQVIEEIK